MEVVWRLCRLQYSSTPLDGEGARLAGARWNPVGTPLVYTASTLSLAVLEMLVHFDVEEAPTDYVSIRIEIPDTVSTDTIDVSKLPPGWDHHEAPAALAAMGQAWVSSNSSAVLIVPSVVVPSERNFLINPLHADAKKIVARVDEPFPFDPRLFSSETEESP